MMRHLLGHLHEHGITLGVPPNGWEASITAQGTPPQKDPLLSEGALCKAY